MKPLAGLAAMVFALTGLAASAQNQYFFELTLEDRSYSLGDRAPVVTYVVYEDEPRPGLRPEKAFPPTVEGGDNVFTYGGNRVEDRIGGPNYTRYFVRADIDLDNLLPTKPQYLLAQLDNEFLGTQPIKRTVVLKSRAQLAELYRAEVNDILRLSSQQATDFERAYKAALGAIDYKGELDNYLLFNKVLRANLYSTGVPILYHPATSGEIGLLLPGFDDLSFSESWLVQVNLLDILADAPDAGRAYGTAGTIREAGILLGTSMLDALETEGADPADLPVVRVYQHLSALFAAENDCVSLSRNAAQALSRAEAIRMAWTAQRRLFLEWGDCLEQMAGFGVAPTREAVVETSAANPFLAELWADFESAGDRAAPRLQFATRGADLRIREIHELSQLIVERSQ